jgi:putative membrane protein
MDATTAGSLSQSMDRAVKHYSSLFMLPSYKKVLLLLALTCISGGLFSTVILFPFPEGVVNGLLLGFSLFFVNLIIDYAVSMLILRRDPIYGLRRTAALSLFSWGLWFFFIFVGAAVAMSSDLSWWIRLSLLGFSAVIILRSIVLLSTSSTDYKRLFAASLLQPFSCIIPFLVFWARKSYPIAPIMFFIIFSLVVGLISSLLFISVLNRVGMQTLGVPSLPLFKAFLLNWIADLNVPFEEFLEKLGENQDVEVSLIKFSSSKPKAVIVVPSVHPGPFKNIGSSLLPSMLKTALETKLNCVVCVPHGLLGHEFDLASQIQNQKIINRVVEFANLEVSVAKATPFIKVSNSLATACCQAFGNFAFLSFTLAPKTTEDLPQELGMFVRQEAERHRLTCCVVVNAHNSIDGTTNMQEALGALKTVAVTCLEKAVSLKRLPFEIGAATVIPKEFGLKEGMGPGGITVVVVKVGGQKTAYVVIDGNNMVSGLRENILSALHSIGIDEGEVFTTDTHSVNAVILNNRGYHPVGEAMDHENLIGYIKRATFAALSELEHVKAACRSITIPEVKVIGEKRLETLCLLIDRTLQKAKKVAVPIFATSGLLLMLILMFV